MLMIINMNNKDDILKGQVHRGFNQTSDEIRDKLLNSKKKIISKTEEKNITDEYYKLKKMRNEIKKIQK